jgi:hypothetical protein
MEASMAGNYVVPGVQVVQQFNAVPAPILAPLRAHVSGPHAFLLRNSVASEKLLADLGPLVPAADQVYPWPHLPLGAVVDPTYTKLFVDDARLEYWAATVGTGDVVAPVAGSPNRVRIADATYGFRANLPGYPRLAALGDRDVQAGDRALVRGVVASVAYSVDTYVLGFAADPTAAVISPATYGSGNGGNQSRVSAVTQTAGTVNCNVLVADVTGYNAYPDGGINETYTIRVVSPSIDGDLQTATLRITSATGLDDALAVAPVELGDSVAVGRRGLLIGFTCAGGLNASTSAADLLVGQTWTVVVHDKYVQIAAASGGAYTGTSSTTYIATVTRGGLFASATAKPQLTFTTTTGVDVSGPVTVSALGAALPVGTQGVTVTLSGSLSTGLRLGDVFYIPATASVDGRSGTLILGHNLPTALQSASAVEVRLSLEKDVVVPHDTPTSPITNWDQTGAALTVYGAMQGYDPTLTVGGAQIPYPIVAGEVFVEYRAWRQELVGKVGTIADAGLLSAAIPGPLTPDNPLAWGVYNALLNSSGTDVKYTAVANPTDPNSWDAVLGMLVGRDDVYSLAPLTTDPTVLGLYAAHVKDESAPLAGDWRALFLQLTTATRTAIVSPATSASGLVVLGTLTQDPAVVAASFTILTATGGKFLANKVAVGDVVRALYTTSFGVESWTEYTVASVVSEDEIKLASGPGAPIAVAQRVEVWHPLSKDEQAAAVGAEAGAYASSRVCAVWPDTVGSGGTTMAGYFLCAAIAGKASGIAPQQGMTNLALAGFDDLARTTSYFNANQLNQMAGDGVYIVTRDNAGVVKARQAVTTDISSLDASEEMIRRNVDACSYFFQAALAPFIGVTNVTPKTIARINAELNASITALQASGYTDTLGGQLLEGSSVAYVRPDALLGDHVVAAINAVVPKALNVLQLYLSVA